VWDAARANDGKTLAMSFYPPSAEPVCNQSTQYIRFAIENLPLSGIGGITASAGVAALGTDYSFETMFDLADRRLYSAKAAGRNTVS